jgi:hypothetical protein
MTMLTLQRFRNLFVRLILAANVVFALFLGASVCLPPSRAAKGPNPGSLTLAVIGDYGVCDTHSGFDFTCTAEMAVAGVVHSWRPAAILTTGDNTYRSGTSREIQGAQKPYRDYIESGNFFPSFGNHDWGTGSLQPSLEYFHLKTAYYKKEFSGLLTAYLLDMNPEDPAGASASSGQARWLATELASSTTPWNVTFDHEPPYSSCGHRSSPAYRWIAARGVDMVFSGHNHQYERLEDPNYASSANLPYIVIGSSGAPLIMDCHQAITGQKKAIYGVFGAVKLDVTRVTLTATFYDLNGVAHDSVSLTKPADRVPASSP